jgi:glycosyltransferase involved in cell wall biosynthesis
MSYGLSCIVSDIPANREVQLAENRYFKPGNIEELKAKLIEFSAKPLTDDDRRKQIAMVAERYNWDDIARRTLGVYESVAR